MPYLLVLAVVFFVLAFSDSAREWCEAHVGVQRLLLAALGFLCLHSAWVAFDVARLRERLLDLLANLMRSLKGADLSRDADAIEILVKAMGSANLEVRGSARGHLVRLTGRDLGDDPERWAAWWAEQRTQPGRPTDGGGK